MREGKILTLTKLNTLHNGDVSIANYYRAKKELFSRSTTKAWYMLTNYTIDGKKKKNDKRPTIYHLH